MGNREDHLRWGFSFISFFLVTIITVIILYPIVLTFFNFQNKVWLFYVGLIFYSLGIFFPDMDHHGTPGGKLLTKLHVKYRHRGNLHSIGASLLYSLSCAGISALLSFIGTIQFTVWIWVCGILAFFGYFNHLTCDLWFDKPKWEEIDDADFPFKFWYIKRKKKSKKMIKQVSRV